MGIQIGDIVTRNRVFLAPMSGVSDEPFRTAAHRSGAGLVVSEMIASEQLALQRGDMVRRSRGRQKLDPFVIQLAGREPRWMAEGARVATDLGADIIDINMGCPAREVTGALSGSALMRDLDHAVKLIEATVAATSKPVTLKMRLGWDDTSRNAPELAARAEQAGIQLVTVHGRTRCQFYKGVADWRAIRDVRARISIPLIANGDCTDLQGLREMLQLSGADGAMIGRGAYGRPWFVAELAAALDRSGAHDPLPLDAQLDIVGCHYDDTLAFYGASHGVRIARKHLGWYVSRWFEQGLIDAATAATWRNMLVRESDARTVARHLRSCCERLRDAPRKAA